jgi:hypothetical protein
MAVVTMNEETQTDTQTETRWRKERREREKERSKSQNIIVTAVHKWALVSRVLGHIRKEVNTN